jgi:hypothetical protein
MTTHHLAYTIDHTRAEASHQRHSAAWGDRSRYQGHTIWAHDHHLPLQKPDQPPPEDIGIWVLPRAVTRAPIKLTGARPHTYRPGDRFDWQPSSQALELGLSVQWDQPTGLVYLTAAHDVHIRPGTVILTARLQRSLASCIASAVDMLRQANLPETAEALLLSRARLVEAVAGAQKEVSRAADDPERITSGLVTWEDVGLALGEVVP